MRRHHILIPLAALIATLPLFTHGCSCGHDFDFHLLSWLEAAQQFRHGTLNPHWAFSPAFNAGEPRFIFYPPLSWTLGALLTMLFPIAAVPAVYTLLALTAAGFTMHRLAAHFTAPNAALLASALYIANPYMLFNAYERTAYAELLAAAWLPLLFLAALRPRPTIRGIAVPVALLWLTNAPAAVMGCYALAVIILIRLVAAFAQPTNLGAPRLDFETWGSVQPLRLTLTATAGTTLGLALAAVYLIPAAYERRFVQIAMAVIPNMRFQDNFLFGHTGDVPHDTVLHTASLLAVTLLAATIISLTAVFLFLRTKNHVILSEARSAKSKDLHNAELTTAFQAISSRNLIIACTTLTLLIAFLLTPLSTPFWNHLPEFAFLQFPWRLLAVLAVVFALSGSLVLRSTTRDNAPSAMVLAAMITLICIHTFRQGCETKDLPAVQAQAFALHQGIEATDEYTPTDADNDILRNDDPPYWLSSDPAAFAPGTTPNPAATIPNYEPPPTLPAPHSTQTPQHFTAHVDRGQTLILNLRDYPAWRVIAADPNSMNGLDLPHIPRDDGLIAIRPYNEGDYAIDITWHRTPDQLLGLLITATACITFAALTFLARRSAH